ncbi:hypothetical protein ACLOJK_017489 [Asimina triloba]
MVVASPTPVGTEKIRSLGVPVIDMSRKGSHVAEVLVKACEDYGFFKVINHGIPDETIFDMESQGHRFFALPSSEKQKAGPPNPVGYGCKNIGFNGDMGEIEYLLLHSNPLAISQRSTAICNDDPVRFCKINSCVVNDYIGAVRGLMSEILELLAEGLKLHDRKVLSRMINDKDSDSLFRINHYPSSRKEVDKGRDVPSQGRIGFGEHSDPQILTILRSNDVGGLQISVGDSVWVPVPPDPAAFFVNVGDALQALTNGRLVSVRHRAMANSYKSRMSLIYFGAPPLHARISTLADLITPQNPSLYRPFTWGEYKKAAYSLRLGDHRLYLFRSRQHEEDN